MRPEWEGRLNNWLATLERDFYEPLGEIALEGFVTDEMLTPDYIRWLYTAFTRATDCLYLVNWPDNQVRI